MVPASGSAPSGPRARVAASSSGSRSLGDRSASASKVSHRARLGLPRWAAASRRKMASSEAASPSPAAPRLPGLAHPPSVQRRPGQGGLGPLRPALAAGGLALAGHPGLEIAGQRRIGAALRVVQHGGRRLGQLRVAAALGGQRLQQRQHRPLERLAGHLGRQRRLGRHLPVARAGRRPHQRLAQLRPRSVAHEGGPVGLLGRGGFPARLEELALLEAQAARPQRILGDLGGRAKGLDDHRRFPGPRRQPHHLPLDRPVLGREGQGPRQQRQSGGGILPLAFVQGGRLDEEAHPGGVIGRAQQPHLAQAHERPPVARGLVGAGQRLGGRHPAALELEQGPGPVQGAGVRGVHLERAGVETRRPRGIGQLLPADVAQPAVEARQPGAVGLARPA